MLCKLEIFFSFLCIRPLSNLFLPACESVRDFFRSSLYLFEICESSLSLGLFFIFSEVRDVKITELVESIPSMSPGAIKNLERLFSDLYMFTFKWHIFQLSASKYISLILPGSPSRFSSVQFIKVLTSMSIVAPFQK